MSFREAEVMTVVAIGDDPSTVVVTDGSDEGARPVVCLSSYSPRFVGDQVIVVRLLGGSWFVMGALGPGATPVAYGTGLPPGGGWRQSTTAYVRDNADGTRSIYLDTAGAIPMPSVVPATGAAGFLSNTDTRIEFPRAGASSDTSGDWFGCWFYNSTIAAACVGKTVSTMAVRIARTQGGSNGPTLLRLGLHNSTGLQPAITNTWVPGVSLSRGGAASIAIPAIQSNLLASGAAQGVAVYGSGINEYADFTASADVTITFA